MSGQYELACQSYTQSLQCAPHGWDALASVYGNRAAALMMLEGVLHVVQALVRQLYSSSSSPPFLAQIPRRRSTTARPALNLDPSLWRVMNRKGRAHMRLGQLQEADACFTRVLELTTPPHQRSTRSQRDSQETLEQGAFG